MSRQCELDRILQLLDESRTSQLRVALVTGDPGIGKTRLLQEVARRAEQVGAYVLHGGACEAEGMPPYLPFLEALGQHIRAVSADTLRTQTGAMTAVLANILPELSVRLGELPSQYPLLPEQARLRLYEAVGQFLAAISSQSGLLLLLDDLHWADPATLDLLWYVARAQANARLLVLGTYREGEVTHRQAFERALTELQRLRLLMPITLGPLSEADLSTLATNQLRSPLDPDHLHRLASQREGNPFFAEELLRDWLATGQSLSEASTLQPKCSARLPSSIVGAVRSRIRRLDSQTQELLWVASMIGRRFVVSLLAGVVGQDAEVVEERLREALEAQVIREPEPGVFAFSHDLLRASLYDEVPLSRRTRLHTVIGRRLALQLHADHPFGYRLSELAFHFAQSLDQEQGVIYSLLAAEEVTCAYAPEAAVDHYRTVLRLVQEADPRRVAWLEKMGEAALLAAMIQEAISAFQTALDRCRQAGERKAAGRAAFGLGRAYWRLEEINLAQEAFALAATLLSDEPSADTVRALVELGSLLLLSQHNYCRRVITWSERSSWLVGSASHA